MSYIAIETSTKFSSDLYDEASEYYNSLIKDPVKRNNCKFESNSAGHIVTSHLMFEVTSKQEVENILNG